MEADFFSDFIQRLAPALRLERAESVEELSKLVPEERQKTRIIGFSTNVIVPAEILRRINDNAINFHPGPPEYPGYRPTGFALYEGAHQYGVTAHYMAERVDEGPIIAAERFDIPKDGWLIDVVKEAYQRLARLVLTLLPQLIQVNRRLATIDEVWAEQKTTKAHYDQMRRIAVDIELDELKLRFRCFDGIYTDLDELSNRPMVSADYSAPTPTAWSRSVS